MGIEIEFLCKPENINYLTGALQSYKNILTPNVSLNHDFFHKEYTIEPNNIFDYGFEIQTCAMDFNSPNLITLCNLLTDISKYSYANDSCGIHVHYSNVEYILKDYITLLYQYMKNFKDKELLTYKGCNLFHEDYASYAGARKQYYYNINSQLRKDKYFIFDSDSYYKKYLYEIRPEFGTIEYRGIRNHFENITPQDIIDLICIYFVNMSSIDITNDELYKKIIIFQ